jgi:hypothetical protein
MHSNTPTSSLQSSGTHSVTPPRRNNIAELTLHGSVLCTAMNATTTTPACPNVLFMRHDIQTCWHMKNDMWEETWEDEEPEVWQAWNGW